jgi:hypothetical protein
MGTPGSYSEEESKALNAAELAKGGAVLVLFSIFFG